MQPDLAAHCQTALSVAQAALPAVGRYLLAGGPELALVCHQVAVYPGPLATVRLGQSCAYVTRPQVVVVYAKDCYPTIEVAAGQAKVPPAAEVTAWTTGYLGDVTVLYDALMGAAEAGDFGESMEGCAAVQLETANWAGPRGGVCSVRIPLTIL